MVLARRHQTGLRLANVVHAKFEMPVGANARRRIDQGLAVDQRHQMADAGVTGVGIVVKNSDGALIQMELGIVGELESQQRELGVYSIVEDRDAFGLDLLVDDGQQCRFLPGQAYRKLEDVLEVLAQLGGDGCRRHVPVEV